ncbi:MAG: hypothetical protein ABL998_14855, partial [Planctomycetota bacterium]
MTHRTTRIRHYLAGIVAACSLGGLLLAFELAYLFQSFEARSNEVGARAGHLQALSELERRTLGWLESAGAALGERARAQELEDSLETVRVELKRVTDDPQFAVSDGQRSNLEGSLVLALDVLRGALELQPESGLFAERVAKGRSTYTELGPIDAGALELDRERSGDVR